MSPSWRIMADELIAATAPNVVYSAPAVPVTPVYYAKTGMHSLPDGHGPPGKRRGAAVQAHDLGRPQHGE